jgi:hypothetical protein
MTGVYYAYDGGERKLRETVLTLPYRSGGALAQRTFTVYHSHHGPIIRGEGDKWGEHKTHARARRCANQSYLRTKTLGHDAFYENMRSAHQLVEQHRLRGRTGQHRLLPRQLHPAARSAFRLE